MKSSNVSKSIHSLFPDVSWKTIMFQMKSNVCLPPNPLYLPYRPTCLDSEMSLDRDVKRHFIIIAVKMNV